MFRFLHPSPDRLDGRILALSERRRTAELPLWTLIVPVLVALVVFANAVPGGFVLDDEWIVQKNPLIRGFGHFQELVSSGYWAARHTTGGLWRPLTMVSYAVNYAVGGLDPSGYHTLNLFLHAGVTLLVTLLLLRVSASSWVALLGGLLFAVHPIHVEAVTNVVGRAEILSCAGVLVALLAHARSTTGTGRSSRGWYALSLLAFSLALLSKENAIAFVVLAPLLDLCVVERKRTAGPLASLRGGLPRYLGYTAVVLVYLTLRAVTLHTLTTEVPSVEDNPLAGLPPAERLFAAFALIPRYAALLVWPARLSYDYGPGAFPLVSPALSLLGILLLGGLVVLFVTTWRRAPAVAFLSGFTLVTYSIVSNLFITIGTGLAERLMYLPSVGLVGLTAIGIVALAGRFAPRARWVAALAGFIIALPLGLRTVDRNRDWRDNHSLFLADAEGSSLSSKVLFNAGLMRFQDNEVPLAKDLFVRSSELHPSAKTSFFLGRALGESGDEEGRRRQYRETAERFPETFHGHLAAGWLRMQDNQYDEARVEFEQAVAMDPEDDSARYNLAVALFDLNRFQDVIRIAGGNEMKADLEASRRDLLAQAYLMLGNPSEARRFAEAKPNPAPGDTLALSRGRALLGQQKWNEAIDAYREVLADRPGDPEGLRGLGLSSYNAGDFAQTIQALEPVDGTAMADLAVYQALGSAYQQMGRDEDAAKTFARGLQRFPDDPILLERLGFIEYTQLKNYADARRHLSRLLTVQPDNPRAAEYQRAVQWMDRQLGMGQ